MTRQEIEKKLKGKSWDKASYAYAIKAMDHWNSKGQYYWTFSKREVVEEFYTLCETRFDRIAHFNTFK